MQRRNAEARERVQREREPGRGEEPADAERRIQHLRAAAENLHAAGMPDEAEKLLRRAEEMQRQVREPRSERMPSPELQELRERLEDFHRRLAKLEQVVEHLTREREKRVDADRR